MGRVFFKLILQICKNEKEEGCCSEMSANTSRVSVEEMSES